MGFIFFIVLFVLLSNTKRDRRRSDIFRLIFIFIIISTVLSTLWAPLSSIAVIGIIIYIIQKIRKNTPQQQNSSQGSYTYQEPPHPSQAQTRSTVKSTILPRPVTKRLKIVRAFNNKYDLNLTPEQMQQIVDSSYMSETWKREVEAMAQKYETVYEWFYGDYQFLRAYIHAFQIQEISSDIILQEQICIQAFDQVWTYADSLPNLTLEERIRRVNETYYTKFDNITFMIAYRFLEKRGKRHKLDTMDLVQDNDDLEQLKRKYT